MTIGWIIFTIVVGLAGILITGIILSYNTVRGIVSAVITIIIILALIFGGLWYFNNTAEGQRALKDQQSNLSNGIKREIIITAEDGREIYYYCGKCDIETNEKYILFEDEEGHRQMIYWGITDTIIISEVD